MTNPTPAPTPERTAAAADAVERMARYWLANPNREAILAAAAKSKRTDAELVRVALGSRPDLGSDVAHAAGALYVARTGNLADWPAEDVERAAAVLADLDRAIS